MTRQGRGRALSGEAVILLTILALSAAVSGSTGHDQQAEHWIGSQEHGTDKPQRIAVVNSFNFCYEVVFGLVFTLGLLKHDVELFLNPLHAQFGVEALLRRFYAGPINSYEDLPKAAEGFDTVIYADWYPLGTPRSGGEAKLQGMVGEQSCPARQVLSKPPDAFQCRADS